MTRALLCLLLLTACTSPPDAPRPEASPAPTAASAAPSPSGAPAVRVGYVGGAGCASCHPAEGRAWSGSDHDLAMQIASEETVRGDFDDATFTDAGATTRFFRDGDDFFLRAVGRDGKEADFRVPYVFGVHPLEQYLVDVGGGRLQAYPIAWDVERAKWISLYPGEEIPPDDVLHWTRFGLNWNQGCADCHSTNLRKGYDVEADTYETTWAEIDVSCEACHGPGEAHVAWARAGGAGRATGPPEMDAEPGPYGLVVDLSAGPFEERDTARQRRQIETCAPCHSRRSIVHPADGPGRPFTDAYRPELLREGLYHADGQILEEVYVFGSFLQSRMYAEGVTCTDCHDPHSLKLVAKGNAVCTQCHARDRYDVPGHTLHEAGSPGSACVACHMVETTYMQVDPRRDHGFHIPRPDLTVELGVPNACGRCHADESAEWARDRIAKAFGPERPDDVHETRVLAAGRSGAPDAAEPLARLVREGKRSAIVRATALHLLAGIPGPVARQTSLDALDDRDPLVRSVAIANVSSLAQDGADFERLVPLLEDESRLVRTEAASALSRVARERFASASAPGAAAFRVALAEYRRGQEASADHPAAQLNLGVLAQNVGDAAAARTAYERARRLEPAFVPARFNLAMLDALDGRPEAAEEGFREVIRLAPELAEARYSLGLLLAEDPARLAESAGLLREAARAEPGNARYQYNAGLAAQHLGRRGEAEGFLRAAVNLEPDDPELRRALAILYVQQERWDEALPQAERVRALVGERPDVVEMVETIRARAAR